MPRLSQCRHLILKVCLSSLVRRTESFEVSHQGPQDLVAPGSDHGQETKKQLHDRIKIKDDHIASQNALILSLQQKISDLLEPKTSSVDAVSNVTELNVTLVTNSVPLVSLDLPGGRNQRQMWIQRRRWRRRSSN